MEVNGKYYTMAELQKIVSMYESNNEPFIGNKDIEYYTFLDMSLDDLRELVQVNRYLKSIINTDDFWCQYLYKHYDVQYKTECLHIGQVLLKNTLSKKFFNKAIQQRDLAVVKFLLDIKQTHIDYADLINITYVPLIKLLIMYLEEEKYTQYIKQSYIEQIIDNDNTNVISQLLENDRIPLSMIKKLLKNRMDKKIHDLLFDYYNTAKLVMPDLSSSSSSEPSSSDSSDDDRPARSPRRASPKRVIRKSPAKSNIKTKNTRTKSPVKVAPKKRTKSPVRKASKK